MIYTTVLPLILASNSPRRKDYLRELGLDFTVSAEEIDETPIAGEEPEVYVERMAREKASAVSRHFPESFVLAADTAVCLGQTILGKPADEQEAVEMLMMLSGKAHVVRSGVCLMHRASGVEKTVSVATEVHFTSFSKAIAEAYVARGESLDKAGAYGIQGQGAFLVERVVGSYTNVVGLPLAETIAILESHGVIIPSVTIKR